MFLHHKTGTFMKKFKKHKDYGFGDQNIRISKLSKLGDPLERLNRGVDFELFRELLETRMSKLPKAPADDHRMIMF